MQGDNLHGYEGGVHFHVFAAMAVVVSIEFREPEQESGNPSAHDHDGAIHSSN